MGSQMQQTTDKVSKKYKGLYGLEGYEVEICSTNYGRDAQCEISSPWLQLARGFQPVEAPGFFAFPALYIRCRSSQMMRRELGSSLLLSRMVMAASVSPESEND